MILLEGINDINMSQMKALAADQKADANAIIAGLSAMVEKAHLHGIKVMGATITATEGLWLYTPQSEATRQAVNTWIRRSGTFDAVVDFDAATRDPARPARLRPDYDSGDHVHPNDAGTRAMAEAIELATFAQ
jgi:lysophospholipase L1-like esterase